MVTTEHVRISKQVKEYLEKQRLVPRETYDCVLRRLLRIKTK